MSTYTIISGEPTPAQYAASSSTETTARRSVDGSQVLLEWGGDTPASMAGLATYTHAEILAVVDSPAWIIEPSP